MYEIAYLHVYMHEYVANLYLDGMDEWYRVGIVSLQRRSYALRGSSIDW